MRKNVIDILFALILISAPFKFANHIFTLPGFFTGPFSHDFVIWPLLLGILYTLYCQWKYKNIFYEWDKFKKYIIAYLIILGISLIWGLVKYPYWDMFFNDQAMDNAKFAMAMGVFDRFGIHIEQNAILPFWIAARFIKNIIFNILYTFGGAYMIFCWYYNRVDRALQLLKNVTAGFLIVVAAYGIVDMCYQNGQWWAQNFISFMWPILHSNTETTHYPMFLGARNRSLFLEASYFAIYMAFAFPILWWKIIETKGKVRWGLVLLYSILACEIFLGQSRTGTALLLGELFLLALVTIYKRKRSLLSFIIILSAGTIISFGSSVYFLQNYQVPAALSERTPLATKKAMILQKNLSLKDINEVGAEAYINDSLLSLVNDEKAEKRGSSNHVRLGITLANVDIGLKHPLLGVGSGLDTAYLYEVFKNDQNGEIKNDFIKPVEKRGLLNSGSPLMCEYSSQFMQSGFLGLLIFVLPMGYVLVCFFRRLLQKIENEKVFYVVTFVTLADIGISITGFGNTVNITYCYWLMIGISYIVEFTLRKHD